MTHWNTELAATVAAVACRLSFSRLLCSMAFQTIFSGRYTASNASAVM